MNTLLKVAIVLLIAFVVLAGLGLLFSARPTPVVGLDSDALAHSVRPSSGTCREASDGEWSCRIEGVRRMVSYRVEAGWDGCWVAERKGPASGTMTPATMSGCVDIWDHLRLENVFD